MSRHRRTEETAVDNEPTVESVEEIEATVPTEPKIIPIPQEMVKGYIEGLQQLNQLNQGIGNATKELAAGWDFVEKRQEAVKELVKQQTDLEKGLKEHARNMEDVCKLDRNLQYQFDLDHGVFIELGPVQTPEGTPVG